MDEQDLELEEDERCTICGGQLDEQLTCQRCIEALPEEKFTKALEKCVQDVHLIEVLYTVPGVYGIIREEYNNEALDQAYQDLVDEFEESSKKKDSLTILGPK